jgi:hypothetical protein
MSIFFVGDVEVKMTFDENMSEVPDNFWRQLGIHSFKLDPAQIQSQRMAYDVYDYTTHNVYDYILPDDLNPNYTMNEIPVQRPEYDDVTLSLDDLISLKTDVVDYLREFDEHYHLSDEHNYILYNYLYAKFCVLRRRPFSPEVDF